MAFLTIKNVAIRGISACVPSQIEENIDLKVFDEGEAERVIKQTGIERRHVLTPGTTASDLTVKAFEVLIEKLGWERDTIDALFYVSSAGDYINPPTSNILQGRLDLSEDCYVMDIRQGCPGWVVGLSCLSSVLSLGNFKRAILLCGDASTLMNSPYDKKTRPLFGDAGTATALEFEPTATDLHFYLGSRGKDFESIMTPVGGLRHPVTAKDLEYIEYAPNVKRRGVDGIMDGMTVFGFGVSIAPKSVLNLVEKFNIDMSEIDYFLFHQANQYMNEKIRKKLKIEPEKVPYCLKDFGNTGGPSIPLTIVTQVREAFEGKKLNNLSCAFGVGLAWGCVHFETENIVCPELILY